MKMPSIPTATAVLATVGIISRIPPLATPPPCTPTVEYTVGNFYTDFLPCFVNWRSGMQVSHAKIYINASVPARDVYASPKADT